MLISAGVWRELVGVGLTLIPRGPDQLELRYGQTVAVLTVVKSAIPLTPGDVAALADRHPAPCLIVVPSATPAVRAAIEAHGWSWLTDADQQVAGVLRVGAERIALNVRQAVVSRSTRPGPVPWGTFTLVRRMIGRPYANQRELAALVGVSQPRVSQAMRVLADQGFVRRGPAGWTVHDIDTALRWWLDSYPGPGGLRTLWYSLDPPIEQARAVAEVLATEAAGSHPAVSGDVAADAIAPWRSPVRAVLYARAGVDLTGAGFVPAGEEEATLELTVPRDVGLWSPAQLSGASPTALPLADPLQILWDVRRAPGPDSEEAADRVWQFIRRRHREQGAAA
ncbi:hypothetical protein DLJ47_19025 [Micromonospora sp. S4605]|nr:hypothetical protein DLJ47_19025 [Micromonospora sp. S4605]